MSQVQGLDESQPADAMMLRELATQESQRIVAIVEALEELSKPEHIAEGPAESTLAPVELENLIQQKLKKRMERHHRTLQQEIRSLPAATLGRRDRSAESTQEGSTSPRDADTGIRSLIEQNPDGILVLDTNNIVMYANPAAKSMLDSTGKQLVGNPFGYPIERKETSETLIHSGGNEPKVAEMRATEIQWAGKPASLVSVHDISHHKRLNHELRRHSLSMTQRARELETTNESLEQDLKRQPVDVVKAHREALEALQRLTDVAEALAESDPSPPVPHSRDAAVVDNGTPVTP